MKDKGLLERLNVTTSDKKRSAANQQLGGLQVLVITYSAIPISIRALLVAALIVG